jgi:hypothetical protein
MNEETARRLAGAMAVLCVRNTCIEDIHAGIEPHSAAGDFSDVKVVTPVGEIPWTRLSRINNDEMRALMKQLVDRIYTVLLRLDDPEFVERVDQYARRMTERGMRPKTSRIGSSEIHPRFLSATASVVLVGSPLKHPRDRRAGGTIPS